ncbi:hypothetical protein SteCoe_12300 [Stentor coeruleus]|uniref:ATP-grasp domain-containing protein n=1 Tax=Stentor coeruleus TaxID=5963 RepID=A0A1R2CB79_9CILI|nr:hypothetical protein SteCoe_12300 [Stentor coeruleus]
MIDFKYLASVQFSKAEMQEDNHVPIKAMHNIRHSLDFSSSLKPKKLSKTNPTEYCKDILNKTSALPFFRPRSPLARLARSLQISRLSKTPNDQSNKKEELRAVSALHGTANPLLDLINPHTPFKGSFLVIKKSDLYGLKRKSCLPKKKSCKQFEFVNTKKLKKIQKQEKLNIKDIKDRKWLNKKRAMIINDFYIGITKSNGMKIQHSIDLNPMFKYYIGKGNNSKLIKQLMSRRQGWTRVKLGEIQSANFIWTEWIEESILQSFSLYDKTNHILEIIPKPHIHYYTSNNIKRFIVDTSAFGYGKITGSSSFRYIKPDMFQSSVLKVYNKIAGNHNLSNKKELFINLEKYCNERNKEVFDYVPVTFHITSLFDSKYQEFERYFRNNIQKSMNIWILKPGENTNRGTGISICTSLEQIAKEVSKTKHTVIIQKYIENPFLVYKRKFDIRCYALITCYNGIIQGYYYNEGYIRTSSKPFSLQNIDNKFIHLTNDAVQKFSEDYGKFENGNKMSYGEFQKYVDAYYQVRPVNFVDEIGMKIKEIVMDTIKCAAMELKKRMYCHTFEVFGYDFLLDDNLKPWLLEVNTNPCLEISSSHLARIIPSMLDNVFQLAIDSIFQTNFALRNDMPVIAENKFELVYHSLE